MDKEMKCFIIGIVAAIILYINTVSIIKKVKRDEETFDNTIVGSFCLAVIIVCIFVVCSK